MPGMCVTKNLPLFSLNNALSVDVLSLLVHGEDLLLFGMATPSNGRSITQSVQPSPRISSAFFLVMCKLFFAHFKLLTWSLF